MGKWERSFWQTAHHQYYGPTVPSVPLLHPLQVVDERIGRSNVGAGCGLPKPSFPKVSGL